MGFYLVTLFPPVMKDCRSDGASQTFFIVNTQRCFFEIKVDNLICLLSNILRMKFDILMFVG